MFPFWWNQVRSGFSLFLLRISRLFSDVKKILLYSQNDKNLDGFKELSQALQLLQDSRSGRDRLPLTSQPVGLQGNLRRCSPASCHTKNFFLCLTFSVFCVCGGCFGPRPAVTCKLLPLSLCLPVRGERGRVLRCSHLVRVQPQQVTLSTTSSHHSTLAAAC